MSIQVLFFGVLTDITQHQQLQVSHMADLEGLKNHLYQQFPKLKEQVHVVALNQELTGDNVSLKSGDEVAFLPPYAGG